MRRDQVKRALNLAGPFKVSSLANGEFTIQPRWSRYAPPDCVVAPDGYCKACDALHIGGLLDRLALAKLIQGELNKLGGHPPEDGR